MRLLSAVWIVYFSLCLNAFAYLEVDSKGDSKLTANEQTTNLYLLSNSNNTTLKRLKKIEELYAKNPELAKKLSQDEIEQIAGGNSQELQRQDILRETKQFLKQTLAAKKDLVVKRDEYFYHQLTNNALQSPKDNRIIGELSAKLGRLR